MGRDREAVGRQDRLMHQYECIPPPRRHTPDPSDRFSLTPMSQ
jgi:hypothetical protein